MRTYLLAVIVLVQACDWPPCDGAECGYDPGPDEPPSISSGPDFSLADVERPNNDGGNHPAGAVVTALGGTNQFHVAGSITNVHVASLSGADVLASGPSFEFRATAREAQFLATSDRAQATITTRALPVATLELVPFEAAFALKADATPFAVMRGATVELVLHVAAADGTRLIDLERDVRSAVSAVDPDATWDLFSMVATEATPVSLSAGGTTAELTIPVVDGIDDIVVVSGPRLVTPDTFPGTGSAYICVEGRLGGVPVAGLDWAVRADASTSAHAAPTSLMPPGGCALVDSPTTKLTFWAAGLQRTFTIQR